MNTERTLSGRVALTAGGSRGCGRGVALALADAGATVYVTGRTRRGQPGPADRAPGSIDDTAEEVTRRGGQGIPVAVDHTDPAQVGQLMARIAAEHGRLDIVNCSVWGGNERFLDPVWQQPFWEQPDQSWGEMLDAGPHAFWLLARGAASLMRERRSGLIVAITEPTFDGAFEGQVPIMAETFSHLAHYAINRLVPALAVSARPAGIAIVGLMPGFMKTERVEMHLQSLGDEARQSFRYDLAETPEYAGRAIAALATDPTVLERSGELLHVADLANEYGFTDVDGVRVGNFYRALGLIK